MFHIWLFPVTWSVTIFFHLRQCNQTEAERKVGTVLNSANSVQHNMKRCARYRVWLRCSICIDLCPTRDDIIACTERLSRLVAAIYFRFKFASLTFQFSSGERALVRCSGDLGLESRSSQICLCHFYKFSKTFQFRENFTPFDFFPNTWIPSSLILKFPLQ